MHSVCFVCMGEEGGGRKVCWGTYQLLRGMSRGLRGATGVITVVKCEVFNSLPAVPKVRGWRG